MKRKIVKLLSSILQTIDTLLCRLPLKRPTIIIYLDGGICSQIYMYVKGQYYAEHGLDVRYDTLWFDVCGKDQFGNMPRVFELLEMWPNLPFKTISKFARKYYLLFFQAQRTEGNLLPAPSSIKHSLYFYEYWNIPSDEYDRVFAKYFDLSHSSTPAKADNDYTNCVGIHVRRGDLAKGDNPAYGGVTDGYFLRAIDFCNEKFAPKKYIFFSDEPDWVEQNICNHLKLSYTIMRDNKAWEDLWYLSHCPIIVASQGSFGKMAAYLNPDAVLIQCDNAHSDRSRNNCYYIR